MLHLSNKTVNAYLAKSRPKKLKFDRALTSMSETMPGILAYSSEPQSASRVGYYESKGKRDAIVASGRRANFTLGSEAAQVYRDATKIGSLPAEKLLVKHRKKPSLSALKPRPYAYQRKSALDSYY